MEQRSNKAATPPAYAGRFLHAQVAMLAEPLPIMVWINPSWAFLSIIPFMGIFPVFGKMTVWHVSVIAAMQLVNSVFAAILYKSFKRDSSDTHAWLIKLSILQAMIGISWGAITWLVWQDGNAANNVLSVMTVVGILWVYALTRVMHTTVYMSGVIPTTLVALSRTVTAPGDAALFLSIFLPVMFLYTVVLGMTTRRKVYDMLRAHMQNEDMTVDLRTAHDEALLRRYEAEAANASKTAFLANMSHELRTPLNAVIGFSEMIEGQQLGPIGTPRYLEYARDIHSAGSHLLSLISDILDVAKIETGKMEVQPDWLDARRVTGGALALLNERVRAKNQRMIVSIADDAPQLYADARAFKQILINLVSNAVKFTPANGRITVRGTRAADGGFDLCVEDNGPGIPTEFVERLFKPFARLDNRYDRAEGGTGLGLSLVRGLAELHGGRAWIDSDKGRGVRAHVYFPVGNSLSLPRDEHTIAAA